MTRSLATNLAMVRRVAESLGDLRDQVVFLAGAVVKVTSWRVMTCIGIHAPLKRCGDTLIKGLG